MPIQCKSGVSACLLHPHLICLYSLVQHLMRMHNVCVCYGIPPLQCRRPACQTYSSVLSCWCKSKDAKERPSPFCLLAAPVSKSSHLNASIDSRVESRGDNREQQRAAGTVYKFGECCETPQHFASNHIQPFSVRWPDGPAACATDFSKCVHVGLFFFFLPEQRGLASQIRQPGCTMRTSSP